MSNKTHHQDDKPRAVAEGDKLPEEKGMPNQQQQKQSMENKDAPKANAEGDKLPESGKQKK
jgi:hypothetical protein